MTVAAIGISIVIGHQSILDDVLVEWYHPPCPHPPHPCHCPCPPSYPLHPHPSYRLLFPLSPPHPNPYHLVFILLIGLLVLVAMEFVFVLDKEEINIVDVKKIILLNINNIDLLLVKDEFLPDIKEIIPLDVIITLLLQRTTITAREQRLLCSAAAASELRAKSRRVHPRNGHL